MKHNGISFALLILGAAVTTASAQNQVVYNSIPKTLAGNVGSEGPEAYAFAELGDGLNLAATSGTLNQVTVVMSSWGCQTGNWYSGNCVTAPGTTFAQTITVNVYAVSTAGVPAPSTLLATATDTFNIPYRPSSTPGLCGGDTSRYYSSKDKTCYHGVATEIHFELANQHADIPANSKVILTVAYNTSHYGPSPVGESPACYSTSAGCPYDSLNIGTDGDGPAGLLGGVGSVLDTNSIFVNYTSSANACSGNTVTGALAIDYGCWTGNHPLIEVRANVKNPKAKGLDK